jgi:AcrR family transcriptional regulator
MRDLQADATRAAIVEAARRLFVENGYADTGTQAIVVAAGVGTRGALYHHFADKEALYLAVFQAIQADMAAYVLVQIEAEAPEPLARLRAAGRAFLRCVQELPEARTLLRDGPRALGWQAFREAEITFGAAPLQALLDQAVRGGSIQPVPTGPMARVLVAALDEAALEITSADDPDVVRAEWEATLEALFDGLADR